MNCNQITFIWNKPLCVFCELFALFYVLVRILWLTIWENEKGLWNVMGNFAIRIKTPIVLVRRVNKRKDILGRCPFYGERCGSSAIKKGDCY